METGSAVDSLKELLQGLDKENIYRSVYGPDGNLLAEGVQPLRKQLIDDFRKVDFKGKKVIDLGCNFGFFSFLAQELGAKKITAVDSVPEVVRGGTLLAAANNVENIHFTTFNFETPEKDLGKFDMVMLIEFFGKTNIRKQKVESIIKFMKSIAGNELLFAMRPINRIEKDLKLTAAAFSGLYPEKYIADGNFYLLEYIKDILADEWIISPVSEYDGRFCKPKILFLCRKK